MNERSQSPSNMSAAASRSSAVIWTGRVLSGLAVAFLIFDAAMKVLQVPMAVEGTVALAIPPTRCSESVWCSLSAWLSI